MNTVQCGCIWAMNSIELLRKAGIETTVNKEIRKIVRYSQDADESSIYVDVSKQSNEAYVMQALEKKAIVLSEKQINGCIHVESASRCFSELLQIFYDFPYRKLKLIGVTGTCGKSTVVHLLKDCLQSQGIKSCAVMTGKVLMDNKQFETRNTTPDASFLIPLMNECVRQDISVLMMEVSSEAFVHHRVEGLYFDVMIGTVIASDHLDTHHTLQAYQQVKRKILSMVKPDGVLILNEDDPLQKQWKSEFDAHVLTYGFSPSSFHLSECHETLEKTYFRFQHLSISTKLLSRANVYNLAAAMACAFVLDLNMKDVFVWAESAHGAAGRFEVVCPKPVIMIDYAHTEKAVRTVLSFLRSVGDQKIICVFGCGGQRDVSKRPLIAKTVCELAHEVIITSDNPRNEEPEKIIDDILLGCTKAVHVEVDRMKAIQFALETCTKNDIIILLGKGEEKMLFSGGQMIEASDKDVVCRYLKEEDAWGNTFLV